MRTGKVVIFLILFIHLHCIFIHLIPCCSVSWPVSLLHSTADAHSRKQPSGSLLSVSWMCIISVSGTLFCSNSFTWLSHFISCLLVPPSCNHLSINHYLLLLSPHLWQCRYFFFPIKNFSSSTLLCNSKSLWQKSKEKQSFTKDDTMSPESWGKDKSDHFTMMTWPTLSGIPFLLFLESTLWW